MVKSILTAVLLIAAITLGLLPGIYWLFHPELTQMQVFLKFWWIVLGALVFFLVGKLLAEK